MSARPYTGHATRDDHGRLMGRPNDPRGKRPRTNGNADSPANPEAGGPLDARVGETPDLTTLLSVQNREAIRASAYAEEMLSAAASACADVLAMRLPPGSRPAGHRSYERELLREFRASYERFSEAWTKKPDG